jgi:STE24 endopeptidase
MNESRAARYQRLRRRAEAVSAAAGALLLVVCAATPAGGWLAGWARRAAAEAGAPVRAVTEVALFVGALALALEMLALPAVMYLSASLDRRFRRGEYDMSGVISAQLHAAAFGVAAAVIIGVVVHLAARETGGWWWLTTGVTLSAILAAAVRGISTLIARAGGARPLADAELSAKLFAMSASAGVPVAGIFEWRASETSGHSASITGFGRGRRVLIAPELLSEWTQEEITVVVAHELSHHKHHDLLQTLAVDAVLMSTALAVADLVLRVSDVPASSLPALPLIALTASLVWLAVTPARHAMSRWQERRADQFALAVTGEADAFAAAVRRVGERNLIEDRPDTLTRWFFHRHPTIEERLAMASSRART